MLSFQPPSGALLALLAVLVPVTPHAEPDAVHVYSARQQNLIAPLLDRFTEATGIPVRLVTGEADPLLERLAAEGAASPADVFLTVDVARLLAATRRGLFQAVDSPVLRERVPEAWRDPQGQWFGLSLRSRVIVRARDRVPADAVHGYGDLADARWQGRICVRSSQSIYNQGLVASLLVHLGPEATEEWARRLVANFARPPKGGDRDQIKAIASGECDLALVNTYYLAGMQGSQDPAERAAAEAVALVWPDQDGHGAHMNVSGAGITRHAPHRDAAVRLLEYLTDLPAQRWYAEVNHEFPVRPELTGATSFGAFRADPLPVGEFGARSAEAALLMDRAGWR